MLDFYNSKKLGSDYCYFNTKISNIEIENYLKAHLFKDLYSHSSHELLFAKVWEEFGQFGITFSMVPLNNGSLFDELGNEDIQNIPFAILILNGENIELYHRYEAADEGCEMWKYVKNFKNLQSELSAFKNFNILNDISDIESLVSEDYLATIKELEINEILGYIIYSSFLN